MYGYDSRSVWDTLKRIDDFMGEAGDEDPWIPNGLQVRGRDEVKVLAIGVSASLSLFQEADALLVHHGLNMPPGNLLDTDFP